MRRMVRDAKALPNHLGDAAFGPQRAPEPIRLWSPLQEPGQFPPLLRGQPRGPSGTFAVAQHFRAFLFGPFHPLADRTLGDPQGRRDVLTLR